MNKLFLALFFLTAIFLIFTYVFRLIYFPFDILNLLPLYHTNSSLIPHNTLVSDPVFQFEPWRHFVKEAISSGIFPLWNNLNAGGVPLFANAQSAVLFPLNAVYYIFPPSVSLNLIPILKLNLLFLFTFFYLRSIKVSRTVAILGGTAICFSGFSLVWLLWPHTNVYLFLPFFLYLTEKIRNGKGEKKWYVLLSLSYCFAIFGGHYETLLHLMLLHLPYAFFRLNCNIRKFFKLILFVILGILISSIQLIPFLEYFFNSSAFAYRTHSSYLYLPFQSAILNVLPFLSGAPHLSYYRPIAIVTNFQESIGGYTGTIILLTALAGIVTFIRKSSFIRLWTVFAVIFWLLAFKVWPIGLLLELPLISQAQNSRLSAIAAFATIMLFALTIERIPILIGKGKRIIPMIFGTATLALLFLVLVVEVLAISTKFKIFHHPYVSQLNMHIVFIAFTTLLFIPALYFVKKSILYIVIIGILIGFQTIYLLIGYIPLLHVAKYYPKPPVIEKLMILPKGTLLEVGNPSIPPDINLMYGISLAQNYDGIEVKEYKDEFDKAFPSVNHWNKVEKISIDSLKKFNISYILTDHNINYALQEVQPKFTSIIGPITESKTARTEFKPNLSDLQEIRILPANYNRINTCVLSLEIVDKKSDRQIFHQKIDCKNVLDKMYFTVDTKGVKLVPQERYVLIISSEETNPQNGVGVWGDGRAPFVELYFKQDQQPYKLLFSKSNIKLFEVPRTNIVRMNGNYKVIKDVSNEFQFLYESLSNEDCEIKKTFYPGWKAYIDGKELPIRNGKPFMQIKLPKGKHIVRIQYDPSSFKFGIVLSLISIIVLLYLARSKKLAQ